MKLEKLLNSLIERGWKPRGRDVDNVFIFDGCLLRFMKKGITVVSRSSTICELVSIESGFWQFVCKKKFVKNTGKIEVYDDNNELEEIHFQFKYRIMLSSIQEDVVSFILENVNIDE